MLKRWIVNALAKAFVNGEATPDAIAERSAKVLGRRWRWLRPLAVRYVKAMSGDLRPRRREAASFLRADDGFRKASRRHRRKLEIESWLQDSPRMEPVAAAETWELPRLETTGELAKWLEVSVAELEWFADLKGLGRRRGEARLRHYSYRVLRKDAASVRLIEAPKGRLKALQRRILSGILEMIPLHDAAHGFRKGRSIQDILRSACGAARVAENGSAGFLSGDFGRADSRLVSHYGLSGGGGRFAGGFVYQLYA